MLQDKNYEILTELDVQNTAKEILTSLQLILCHSNDLPLHIVGDLFDSILIIINSTQTIGQKGKFLQFINYIFIQNLCHKI